MAQTGFGRRYFKAFVSGFFVAVPVTVTVLDRLAYVAYCGLDAGGESSPDVVLLNRWSVRNYRVQRGDIVSVLSPKDPRQKIIKRVIGIKGDFIKTLGYKNRYVRVPDGHLWIEGDHHGHSFDSNTFGLVSTLSLQTPQVFTVPSKSRFWGACWNLSHVLLAIKSNEVSLGLIHGRASHIIWPPSRWQRIEPSVPPERRPLLNWDGATEDGYDD